MSTNIGRNFLRIIDTSFPEGSPLRRIFNRNTVKLSYSCMPNIQATIRSHNTAVFNNAHNGESTTTKQCNCRRKENCPLSGKSLTASIVYQATVTREDGKPNETYVGLTEGTFKSHYLDHASTFGNDDKPNSTELRKYIWSQKNSNVNYSISWKIFQSCKSYSAKSKRCNLCLHEKYLIICHPELSSLNTRNELVSTCRHRKKTPIVQKKNLHLTWYNRPFICIYYDTCTHIFITLRLHIIS